jgi:outer membrane protein assembly factor BamB
VLGVSSSGAAPSPAVAVVADGRWIWKQDVSAYTFAVLPEPAIATVRKESVVVPYWDTQNQALRLSALGLKKGQRLWDISLIENAPRTAETDLDVGVTLDGAVLVRLPDGRLNAYSLQSGKLVWSVGEP